MRKCWDSIIVLLLAFAGGLLWKDLHDFGSGKQLLWTGMYTGFFSLIILPFLIWKFKRIKLGVYLLFLLYVVLLSVVPTTSRDFFVRHLYSLQPGMTISKVDMVMNPYKNRHNEVDVTGHEEWLPKEFKTADMMVSFRHSDAGNYNADIGEVYFRNNRVLGIRFLPD